MAWTYDDIRLYTSSLDESSEQIIARLQPIASGTILHNFGWSTDIVKVTAIVATEADKDALKALRKTGESYTLSGPEGLVGDFFLKSFKGSRTPANCTVLFDRPSLESDVPLYKVDLELYIDE